AFPAASPAQTVTIPAEVWTGGPGTTSAFTADANWADGTAPEASSATTVVFGPGAPLHAVTLPPALTLGQIQLQGGDANTYGTSYLFTGDSTLILHGGLTTDFGGPAAVFDSKVTLALADAQTFALQGGTVTINGAIADAASGTGKLTVTNGDYGWGTLILNGANTFSGGLELAGGTLQLSGDSALGTGAVTITSGTNGYMPTLRASGPVTVKNDVTLQSAVVFEPDAQPGRNFTFTGAVTLDGAVFLHNWTESPVYFDGAIGEANGSRALQIESGVFVLSAANTYSGGTHVGANSAAVFASSQAVPASGAITGSYAGYVGIAFGNQDTATPTATVTEPTQTTSAYQDGLVARLDPANFFGTLGFDTDPGSNLPDNAYAGVDVSKLVNFQGLGSLTRALINGPITLGDGQNYRFGGGGGTLNVSASLFDQPLAHQLSPSPRGLQLSSPYDAPLTLSLRGANTFSGGIQVSDSVLIIDGAGALPGNGDVTLNRGYFGFTENYAADPTSAQIAAFFSRVTSHDSESVFGLDSVDRNHPRTLSSDIDLSFGNTRSGPVFLGTATKVVLDGRITPPLSSNSTPEVIQYDALRLAAVKEGHLIVNAVLDERIPSLVIGTVAPLGDADGTVELNAANTFSGGTVLQGGTLLVGHDQALGTGTLAVRTFGAEATLASSNASGVTLGNPVDLFSDYSHHLVLGEEGNTNPLTLNGDFTGGHVRKTGPAAFTLGGANAFQYLTLSGGRLVFTHHHAANTTGGAGSFFVEAGTTAAFTTLEPVLHSLSGAGSLELAANSVLTLDIPLTDRPSAEVVTDAADSLASTTPISKNDTPVDSYWGTINGSDAALVKTGAGMLLLGGANTYGGGTTIHAGTLVAQSGGALGAGTVTVDGGALGLDHGMTLTNSLTFTRGALLGYGTFAPVNGAITIGAGQALSPGGDEGIGMLSVATELTFAAGGMVNLELGAPTGTAGIDYDLLNVSKTLAVTATSDARFVINLLAGDSPNTAPNADADVIYGHTYTFTFAQAAAGITGFISTDQFLVNATQLFADTGIPGAEIAVTLENDSLVLNFTPVPEPSTYALLALGLGIVGVAAWRQRRRG
ncbi:MAG TPA: autotransporter-associated beta strand repeat-containing protein, partial [Opitutaceae bacterium]